MYDIFFFGKESMIDLQIVLIKFSILNITNNELIQMIKELFS
jgi:hypothetical protein